MAPRADEFDEIHWRLRISNLEERIELCAIEATALSREVASPLTPETRRSHARERRSVLLTQASEFQTELDRMRTSFPQWSRH